MALGLSSDRVLRFKGFRRSGIQGLRQFSG